MNLKFFNRNSFSFPSNSYYPPPDWPVKLFHYFASENDRHQWRAVILFIATFVS